MARGRFYVLEHTGYRIHLPILQMASRTPTTEVMVIDSGECHAVVWSSELGTRRRQKRWRGESRGTVERQWRRAPLVARRAYAAELAARLNAECAA